MYLFRSVIQMSLSNCLRHFVHYSYKTSVLSHCQLKEVPHLILRDLHNGNRSHFLKRGFSTTSHAVSSAEASTSLSSFTSSVPRTIKTKSVLKKQQERRRLLNEEQVNFMIGFCTAESYRLEDLKTRLDAGGVYKTAPIPENPDALHILPVYRINAQDSREAFLFRDGVTVFWNVSADERAQFFRNNQSFEERPHSQDVVMMEAEKMPFRIEHGYLLMSLLPYVRELFHFMLSAKAVVGKTIAVRDNNDERKMLLQKFTISDAIASSVKLAIWEQQLDELVDSIEDIVTHLRSGKITVEAKRVLQISGHFLSLRYLSLNAEILETPDYYWEHDDLEQLYNGLIGYFGIRRRTEIFNEKVTYGLELVEVLNAHLKDKHSTKLEWIIIILIALEVFFEVIPYVSKTEKVHGH